MWKNSVLILGAISLLLGFVFFLQNKPQAVWTNMFLMALLSVFVANMMSKRSFATKLVSFGGAALVAGCFSSMIAVIMYIVLGVIIVLRVVIGDDAFEYGSDLLRDAKVKLDQG